MATTCLSSTEAMIKAEYGPSTPVSVRNLQPTVSTSSPPELDFIETPGTAEIAPSTPGTPVLIKELHSRALGLESPTPLRAIAYHTQSLDFQDIADIVDTLPDAQSKARHKAGSQAQLKPFQFNPTPLQNLDTGLSSKLGKGEDRALFRDLPVDFNFGLLSSRLNPPSRGPQVNYTLSVGRERLKTQVGADIPKSKLKDSRNKELTRILPYDTLQRLQVEAGRCIASLRSDPFNARCQHRCVWTAQDTNRLLKDLADISKSPDIDDTISLMRSIIQNAICTRHWSMANGALGKLLITPKSKRNSRGSITILPWKGSDSTKTWVAAILSVQIPLESVSDTTTKEDTAGPNGTTADAAVTCSDNNDKLGNVDKEKGRDKGQLASKQEPRMSFSTALNQIFVPYLSERLARDTTEKAIREYLIKPLGVRDREPAGYIYIYWVPGNFGYVKIGRTRRDFNKRLEEWKKCGHDFEYHNLIGAKGEIPKAPDPPASDPPASDPPASDPPASAPTASDPTASDSELHAPILHVSRVENLIHAELRVQRRIEAGCKKCHKRHNEWFEVNPDHAVKVATKWAKWMMDTLPYDSRDMIEARAAAKLAQMEDQSKKKADAASSDPAMHKSKATDRLSASITEKELVSLCQPSKVDWVSTPLRARKKSAAPSTHGMTTRSKTRQRSMSTSRQSSMHTTLGLLDSRGRRSSHPSVISTTEE